MTGAALNPLSVSKTSASRTLASARSEIGLATIKSAAVSPCNRREGEASMGMVWITANSSRMDQRPTIERKLQWHLCVLLMEDAFIYTDAWGFVNIIFLLIFPCTILNIRILRTPECST